MTSALPHPPHATATWTVLGMSCQHCVDAVTARVSAVPGVLEAHVDLADQQLRVVASGPLDDAAVIAAVDEAGFEVKVPG
jgi:copper chaperone CopZ